MMLSINESDLDVARVNEVISNLFSTHMTGAFSTVASGQPLVCTVYCAYKGNSIWFTSQATTRHVVALRDHPAAAFAIWHEPAMWGSPLLGLQLNGKAREVDAAEEATEGLSALHEWFPGTRETVPDVHAVVGPERRTAMVRFIAESGILIDEATFGSRHFLRLSWDDA